jgi:hypothetical protein
MNDGSANDQAVRRLSELDFMARGLIAKARLLHGLELDGVIAQLDEISEEAARIAYGKRLMQHRSDRLELLIKHCDFLSQGDRETIVTAIRNGSYGN